MNRLASRWRRRAAAQLVEFAIVLPALVTAAFPAFDIARAYLDFQSVEKSLQIGARMIGQAGGDMGPGSPARAALDNQLSTVGIPAAEYCAPVTSSCEPSDFGRVSIQITPASPVTYGSEIQITAKYRFRLSIYNVMEIERTKPIRISTVSEQY